jgi:cation transport regulator ChaC
MPKKNIKVVGYGSLMSKRSLRQTIRSHSNYREVWIHGYRRTFDLKSPKRLYEPWDKDIAVLNVETAPKCRFNAVIFEVSPAMFHKIIEREKSYYMVKVKYTDYRDRKVEGEAFLFVGLEQNIDKNLHPRTHYFHICRKAAYDISEKFGRDWDSSTYLQNGRRVDTIKDIIPIEKYHKIKVPYVKTKI